MGKCIKPCRFSPSSKRFKDSQNFMSSFLPYFLKTRSQLIYELLSMIFYDLVINMICCKWKHQGKLISAFSPVQFTIVDIGRWTRQSPLSTLPFPPLFWDRIQKLSSQILVVMSISSAVDHYSHDALSNVHPFFRHVPIKEQANINQQCGKQPFRSSTRQLYHLST